MTDINRNLVEKTATNLTSFAAAALTPLMAAEARASARLDGDTHAVSEGPHHDE